MTDEKKIIRIDLNGDWSKYQSRTPPCMKILGTITLSGEHTEALAIREDSGEFVRIWGDVYEALPREAVLQAIRDAVKDKS